MEENGKCSQTSIPKKITTEQKKLFDKLFYVLDTLQAERWTWNRNLITDVPLDVNLLDDDRTAIFHPRYSIGTAAIFGEKTLRSTTIAYWEMHVPAFYGTSIMFGIGRRSARTYSLCHFEPLLGDTREENKDESFGLSHLGILYGGRFNGRPVVAPRQFCERFEDRPTNVGLLFHGPEGWLAYFIEGKPLGIAFTNIDASRDEYYPMVSSTSQRSIFTLTKQISVEVCQPLSDICLELIIAKMSKIFRSETQLKLAVDNLNLPHRMDLEIISKVLRINEDMKYSPHQNEAKEQPNSADFTKRRRKRSTERDEHVSGPSRKKNTSETLNWATSFKHTKVS